MQHNQNYSNNQCFGRDCGCGCGTAKTVAPKAACSCDCTPECSCGCQDGAPCTCGNTCECEDCGDSDPAERRKSLPHSATKSISIPSLSKSRDGESGTLLTRQKSGALDTVIVNSNYLEDSNILKDNSCSCHKHGDMDSSYDCHNHGDMDSSCDCHNHGDIDSSYDCHNHGDSSCDCHSHGDIDSSYDCRSHGDESNHKKSKVATHKNHDKVDDGCGCGRCEDTTVDIGSTTLSMPNRRGLILTLSRLALSIVLMLIGIFVAMPKFYDLIVFIPALLFAGGEYILRAIKNIFRGHVFDENFLMTIASIGAFAIGECPEGIAVMLLYSVGEMLQDFALSKSRGSIANMLNLKSPLANLLRDGVITSIATDDIKVGDHLVIYKGEKIPVDGVVVVGKSYIDNSMLTGESKPFSVGEDWQVMAGCILIGESITIKATKVFADTDASKIIDMVQNSQSSKPKTQQFITKFAKIYTPIVVIIALMIAFLPPIFIGWSSFSKYLQQALVFLVISCPCALVISVPLGFFSGIGGASKHGVLFKGGNYMEALNSVDIIAFDKTGTLTEGVFSVSEIYSVSGDDDELMKYMAIAESKSSHPIAKSILSHYNKSVDTKQISYYKEIEGKGISAVFGNDAVLVGSHSLMVDNGYQPIKSDSTGSVVHLALNGSYKGYISISDKIKDNSLDTINYLKSIKKDIILLSGDREASVSNLAFQLGINDYHAELLPKEKVDIIQSLISSGKKVAFVGDGLNDAPALKLSNVGICISGVNNDASIESADIVLSQGNIAGVSYAFKAASKTRSIVTINIALSLITKLVIMILSMTILPSMWLALVADVGVSLLAIGNSARAAKVK